MRAIAKEITVSQMFKELEEFFECGAAARIKSLNKVLSGYVTAQNIDSMRSTEIEDVVFDVTDVVSFLATMQENWQLYKEHHPEVEEIVK